MFNLKKKKKKKMRQNSYKWKGRGWEEEEDREKGERTIITMVRDFFKIFICDSFILF